MTEEEKPKIFEWIKQAKEGNQRAFTKLYERFRETVFITIDKIVKNKDVTDDVLSTTFLKAFTKIDTYVDDISFEMWLKTIATNSAIDYIRRTKKEKLNNYIDDEECKIQLSDVATGSAEDLFCCSELHNEFENILSKMNPRRRNILRWKTEENLSNEEIAERLGLTETQVKFALSAARARVRKILLTKNYQLT